MKTLLYNSVTNKVISQIFDNGYLVDGKHDKVKPPIYELEYKPTIAPNITETQVRFAIWIPDIILGTYIQVWEVRDKTEVELITEKEIQALEKENELNVVQIKSVLRHTTNLLTEEEQVNFYSLYPAWKPNISVIVGDKYQYLGLLYKVVQSHNTQLDWEPQNVPALFVRIAASGEIPDWIQPTGAHDAYQIGDKVRFNGSIYESLIEANVWSPTVYPAGWAIIEVTVQPKPLGLLLTAILDTNTPTGANINPIDLNGLAWEYEANSVYLFRFIGEVLPQSTNTGCGFQLNVSSVVNQLLIGFYHQLANTGTLTGGSSRADDASIGVTSGMASTSIPTVIIGNGILKTGANVGTAQLRFRSEIAAISVARAGFTLVVEKVK